MIPRATAQLDRSALVHNLRQVKARAPNSLVTAMIKANGYGHGIINVAKTLTEAEAFGVAGLEEALHLRKHSIQQPIVLMAGFFEPRILPFLVQHNLIPVIHELWQVEAIEQAGLSADSLSVWMKIDTGMHRLGFPLEQAQAMYQRLLACRAIKKPFVIMTHFANADDEDSAPTLRQLQDFQELTHQWHCEKSLANSASILNFPQGNLDFVRPGIMLYGATTIKNKTGLDFNLKPVMTLKSRLISIHQLRAADAVGYGGIWRCPQDMPVGVVSIGYGDGYPRHAENGTPVLINQITCPIVGRISMDMLTVDLRPYPQAKIGEEVTLWGRGLPIEQVANHADTIALQIFCNVTSRVQFEWV